MAPFYAMTVPEFLAGLGLPDRDLFDLEWRLSEGEGAQISARTGLSPRVVQGMTFGDLIPDARVMIRRNRYHCPECPADVQSKSAAVPWIFRCPVHGSDYQDMMGETLPVVLGSKRMAMVEASAKVGANVLNAWARGTSHGDLTPVEILSLLTTRHLRAAPPSLSEQPRMSLQTRRDYHAFMTTPILRQALTVIVPEYDQAAPVLAKPVRPGLHALAQGSLLQCFALTVGIGRIVGDPVARAIDVQLASDMDGQERVREALRSWPLSLRRSISARFWRAERDERARQSDEKAARQRQSHKYRLIQSQKYRYRIS